MTFDDDFSPNDYLDISFAIENSIKSDVPISTSKNAAWLRCALSRAYYSAFLSIRSEFEKDPELSLLLQGEGKDHQTIITKLFTLRGGMRIHATNLFNLRKNRNHCDYHLPPNYTINVGKVEKANKDANKLITNSQYIINNLPK